ncbi:hypothetical protein MSSAC_2545 [Methanosarcina siciliae C2J]|uniref:Uncharacterized protein n=1 Tax=Methanosarcina siciliae C2J TaxID=1434118 RepID=A0A0E3PQ22_9EURY|nr:hypothetical protein [Methanosarcina siciliae]AKB37135.1 hypothetical protein MSSAC_2545 [Methanosarcina siciliae C2J]
MRLTVKEENESGCDLVMKDGEEAEIMHFDNLRGLRYCEVFLMCGDAGSGFYNTMGLNNEEDPRDTCPDSIMANFSTEAVKELYNVPGVALNPPRYFVLDAGNIPVAPTVRDFDGLKAQWMGTVQAGAAFGKEPYMPTKVDRKSEIFFEKGKPVFILDDPDGTPWVMKSYTDFVDKNLTYEDLNTLDTKLKLPSGWSYRVKVLDEDLILRPFKGTARITQDDLQNVYDAIDEGTANYKP